MLQRGPTATALSPGLYIDAARMLGSCNISSASSAGDSTVAVNSLPPGMYAAGTMSPKLIGITPVLTRIQSPPAQQLPTKSDIFVHTQHISKTQVQAETPPPEHALNGPDGKIQKKHKIGRVGLSHANEELGRSLHSLKMTIRRTSQAHQVHPSACSVVTPPEPINACVSCDIAPQPANRSAPSPLAGCTVAVVQNRSPCSTVNASAETTSPSQSKTDACTSTLSCATITEPDLLGPCQPGTKVVVEGVVWLETTGMLVLNIQWRGRAYMGTLLDASKQSFGQSCPDKGIISALSLLNGRRAWPHGSPGRFRTRGLHHFHHHHHHHHTARHRHLPPGASMTTRSAAAAAAASIEPAESIRSVEPELELVENHDDDCQPSLSVYDLEVLPGPESYSSNGPQRGTKRKRRRGAGVGRPCRRVATKLNAESTALVAVSPERNVHDQSPHLEQATKTDTCAPDSSTTPIPFSCPYPGCKKEFPDLLSMRYHFSMGHITRDQALDDSPPSNPSQPERNLVTVVTESEQNSETVAYTVEPNCTLIRHPPPIQSSPPPTLGRAHGVIKEPTDEHGLCMASLDDRFDDNLAPPRLHRIVSITDSVNEFSERRTVSSPSKQTRSPSPNDEPPAPSPAYSDISDDGTVPAELQDSSFTGDSPNRHLSSVSQSKLFTPGHTLLSPLAGSLVSRRATAFEFKASPSIASPVLTHSPTMRHGVQNGFYFPVSILPHVVSAPHSPSAVVSNSNSVMSGLSIVTNSIDLRPSDHLPGRGLSPSLPLSTYAPITQATYLLPTPPPTICTSHFIPAPHTVCIPGVNSFSTPPPTLTAVATHRPTIATAVTNVSTTTLYSISSSVSTSNRHHIGTPETDHTTDSAVLSRSKPPDTGVYQTSHYPHHRHHQMRRGSGSIRRPHHSDLQHSSTLGLSSLDFRSDPSHIRTQVGVSSTRCAGSVDR